MKTLIGIVTFGNLPFTQLTINEIRATTARSVDLFVVTGKPDDTETGEWIMRSGISGLKHCTNKGFPASLNDIMDVAFGTRGGYSGDCLSPGHYDNLIIMGNDVIPYPGAIDAMIECAETTDNEWICASQYNVLSLVRDHPEVAHLFSGPTLNFTDFTSRPWDAHLGGIRPPGIAANARADVRNLCLFKRSVFDKLGYADVNFWPNGYFEDNDYCRRADLAGVKACTLDHAAYFHFWSRTIHQGDKSRPVQFDRNANHYKSKWGGLVGAERITDESLLKISSRDNEATDIAKWVP